MSRNRHHRALFRFSQRGSGQPSGGNEASSAQRQEEEELKTLERYQYDPLSASDRIRVFHFHGTKSRLECTIREIKLADGCHTALSYEWGSSDTPFRMIVRGLSNRALGYIPLTTNLRNALEDLRETPGLEGRHYWIDQVTINQSDNLEKGHQVKFMKDVYHNAFQVITYLGPHAENIEEETQALDLLSRIDTHFRPNYMYLDYDSIQKKYFLDSSELPIQEPPDDTFKNDPAWPALLHIVFGAWLRRLWMVQENILCSNTVMLRGRQQFDWLSVAAIPILFYLNLLPTKLLDRELSNLGLAYHPAYSLGALGLTWDTRLAQNDGNKTNPDDFPQLAENLSFYDALDCADPRDRIFAVLGVSENTDVLGIEPDYKIPVYELYTQVSKRIFIHYQDLYLLEVVGTHEVGSHPLFPSWAFAGTPGCMDTVSDFNPHPSTYGGDADEREALGPMLRSKVKSKMARWLLALDPRCWLSRRFRKRRRRGRLRQDQHLDTGKVSIRFEDNDRTMVTKGRIVGKLRFLPEPVGLATPVMTEEWIRLYTQIATLISSIIKAAANPEASAKALLFALAADPAWSSTVPDTSFYTWCLYRFLTAYLHSLTSGSIERQKPLCDEIRNTTNLLHKLLGDDYRVVHTDPWSPLMDEEDRIGNEVWQRTTIEGRSIGITENEEICNVTGRALPGDVIALLAGGNLAYVLRPVGDKYQYIGEAYVHDFVDGAAYKDVSPEEVDVDIRII